MVLETAIVQKPTSEINFYNYKWNKFDKKEILEILNEKNPPSFLQLGGFLFGQWIF